MVFKSTEIYSLRDDTLKKKRKRLRAKPGFLYTQPKRKGNKAKGWVPRSGAAK